MLRRVVIPSIVLVSLGLGWIWWPRVPQRDVPMPAVWRSTPSAADEAGGDYQLSRVSPASDLAERPAEQLAQDSAMSIAGRMPQQRRARSHVQGPLPPIVRPSPQGTVAAQRSQGGFSTESLRQVASVPEHSEMPVSTAGLDVNSSTEESALRPPDPMGVGTLGEPTLARAPVLRPPVLLAGTPPEYPTNGYQVVLDRSSLTPHLQVEATEGRVILRLLVVANGGVDRVDVTVSSGFEILDQAAAAAVRAWLFAPATRDGQPIDAWVVIPMRFVIR